MIVCISNSSLRRQLTRAAVFLFTVCLASAQTSADLFALGFKQFGLHQFTEAKASFTRATELDPKYSDAYRALGMTDLELQDYQSAYRDWLKAVDLNPKDEKSKYYLGRLFYEADLPNEAAHWLRDALTLSPNDYEAETYLGLCAEALSLNDTAERLYKKAIRQSKDQNTPYSLAYLSLGNFFKMHGEEDQAVAVLEEGSQSCPEAHELSALGELLVARKQTERAEQVLRQAIALDPDLSQAHYRLSLLLRSLGKADEARAEMAKFQEDKKKEDTAPKILALRK